MTFDEDCALEVPCPWNLKPVHRVYCALRLNRQRHGPRGACRSACDSR